MFVSLSVHMELRWGVVGEVPFWKPPLNRWKHAAVLTTEILLAER